MINLDVSLKQGQIFDIGRSLFQIWIVMMEEELMESEGKQRLVYISCKVIEIAGIARFCHILH